MAVVPGRAARLAGQVWAVFAAVFVMGGWTMWALDIENGLPRLMNFVALSAGIVILGRWRRCSCSACWVGCSSGGERRRQRQRSAPAALLPAGALAGGGDRHLITALALFQSWGWDVLDWFGEGSIGRNLLSAFLTILIAAIIAVAIWEGANAAVNRRLSSWSERGDTVRAARLRTLLPMLRTACHPGRADRRPHRPERAGHQHHAAAGQRQHHRGGAGLRLAKAGAGFHHRHLPAAGKTPCRWATGSPCRGLGHRGIPVDPHRAPARRRRLPAHRAFQLGVAVNNINRGLGNAALRISVGYEEDIERVIAELKDIGAGMRADDAFKDLILADLEIWGVDAVDGSMVTIAGQMRCLDKGRWGVQRELNRRILERFRERGIEIANPRASLLLPSEAGYRTLHAIPSRPAE